MNLERRIKEDIKLFENTRNQYEVLDDAIAGRRTLLEMVEGYRQGFEEFTNVNPMNILRLGKIRQEAQQYESEFSRFVEMLENLDSRLSSLRYSVDDYADASKNLQKYNRGKWTMVGGIGTSIAGFLLMYLVFPIGLIFPILMSSVVGGGVAGIRGGREMKSANPDVSVNDIREGMTNYFNALSESADELDHRIGLAYAAERISTNRAAFERDYLRFSVDERRWCRGYLEKMLPLGILNIGESEFKDYFKLLDGKVK